MSTLTTRRKTVKTIYGPKLKNLMASCMGESLKMVIFVIETYRGNPDKLDFYKN